MVKPKSALMLLLFGALLTASAAPTPADATEQCLFYPVRFYFGAGTLQSEGTVPSKGRCDLRVHPGATTTFDSYAVAAKPAHGSLRKVPGGTFVYQPAGGYRGIDRFAIRLCGTSRGHAGCTTIAYTMTVM